MKIRWQSRVANGVTFNGMDACYLRDKLLRPGEGHALDRHRQAIVTLVLDGELREGFDDGTQRCARWQLHFKPAGVPHVTGAGPRGVHMRLLALDPGHEGLPSVPTLSRCAVMAARAFGKLEAIARGDAGAMRELIGAFMPRPEATAPVPTWLTEAYERAADPSLTLRDLAREFRVHPVYLARRMRRHYGRSPGELRRTARVGRAVRGLTEGSASLADLAFELGYADQSHFTREFRRETGGSPGRFRRRAAAARRGEVSNVQDSRG